MYNNVGVISIGIKAPIIREGDDLEKIVVDSVLNATKLGNKMVQQTSGVKGLVEVQHEYNYAIDNKDIIGITESVVARAQGNYVTVDEIAEEIRKLYGDNAEIMLIKPIYSRNRFSMILKGIARAASKLFIVMPPYDEVGNPSGVNPFTGVDIEKYYQDICLSENCKVEFKDDDDDFEYDNLLYCGLHDFKSWINAVRNPNSRRVIRGQKSYTLFDICSDKCEYGLLGSNKATEEKLKLFPNRTEAEKLCQKIQEDIASKTGKIVYVCVYGDGCFKDPVGGIWEFADPISMPAYTNSEVFDSTPNEIKIKAFADDKYKDLNGDDLSNAIKEEIKTKDHNLVGNMASQGTTPRKIRDLIASLCDLTTGSGDKGCPFVLVKNYFKNYSD